MDWLDAAKLYGLPGLIIVALYLLARDWLGKSHTIETKRLEHQGRRLDIDEKKADAMALALTTLSGKIDAHATADIQSHNAMASGLAELHGKLDGVLDERERTPVEGLTRVTPPQGVPSIGGYYQGPKRPGTKGDR